MPVVDMDCVRRRGKRLAFGTVSLLPPISLLVGDKGGIEGNCSFMGDVGADVVGFRSNGGSTDPRKDDRRGRLPSSAVDPPGRPAVVFDVLMKGRLGSVVD